MISFEIIRLEATKVRFYSENDEAAFFEWIDKLKCVKNYEGKGATIYFHVSSKLVGEDCLRELLAIFWRYGISMRQLAIFDREEFSAWFRDPRAYWYGSVFSE